MAKKLRWGLIATGAIARKFAAGVAESETGELVAIGSRTLESAERFARDFPATTHGSYEELLADREVEAVYISTPHPMHAEWAIKAAEAGKHILCEKPLAMNHAEASAIVEAARAHDVFLMEAFMYRCHPQTERLAALIREGAIGTVGLVQASFSFRVDWNPESRLLKRALGGGSILDIGCYCASMARLVAGATSGQLFLDPEGLDAFGTISAESGTDVAAIASLQFPNGMLAQLNAGVRLAAGSAVRVWGDAGDILVPSPWAVGREPGAARLIVTRKGATEEISIPETRHLYAIEADNVARHIEARQSPAMTWADSLGNMGTLDRWRAAIGLRYDGEA